MHRLRLCRVAALAVALALPSASSAAATATEPGRVVSRTNHRGIVLVLRLPTGPWGPDQRIEGSVTVRNTTDRNAYFYDIGCTDVSVEVRLPTRPDQGRDWPGKLGEFKRRALSAALDVGPRVDRFRVRPSPQACAEPGLEHLRPGGHRDDRISWRVRHIGFGTDAWDVTALFGFEGFKAPGPWWGDAIPAEITTSLRVAAHDGPARLVSPGKAIDAGLAKRWVRADIRASNPDDWYLTSVALRQQTKNDPWAQWAWDVTLQWDRADPRGTGWMVNAETGKVYDW